MRRQLLIAYESIMLILIGISLTTIFISDATPPIFEMINTIVWVVFLIDVTVRLFRAISRWQYIKKNPFDIISIIPFEDFFLLARFGRLIKLFRYKNLIKRYLVKLNAFAERLPLFKISISVAITITIIMIATSLTSTLTPLQSAVFTLRSFIQFNYAPDVIADDTLLFIFSVGLKIGGILYIGLVIQHVWHYAKLYIDRPKIRKDDITMPNHIEHTLTFKNTSDYNKIIDAVISVHKTDGDADYHGVDFNNIVKMPESLQTGADPGLNVKTDAVIKWMQHNDYELDDMVAFILKTVQSGEYSRIDDMFSNAKLLDVANDREAENNAIAMVLNIKYMPDDKAYLDFTPEIIETWYHNVMQHGYTSWNGWSKHHWGTKWNAYTTGLYPDLEHPQIVFSTAWNVVYNLLEKLQIMTNVEFDLFADDEGGSTYSTRFYNGSHDVPLKRSYEYDDNGDRIK